MKQELKVNYSDPLLKLSHIGGWFAFIQAVSVLFAIVTYFIWPHVFSDHNAKMIFDGIQSRPFIYFIKLDPIVLFGTLLQFPVWLGLWAILRQRDEAISALALTFGLISTVAILNTRPIIEMYSLSSLYFTADTAELKNIYCAAGETLLAEFHGTSWAVSIISGGLAAILFAIVMRKSAIFQKATFWTMIISGIGALIVLIPIIGLISLFAFGTIVGLTATILCGIDLLRIIKKVKSTKNEQMQFD
jgi:hypothetical protein